MSNMNGLVFIYSKEDYCYWRDGKCGYTYDIKDAGVYEIEEAIKSTKHCGKEKGIIFISLAVVMTKLLNSIEQQNPTGDKTSPIEKQEQI